MAASDDALLATAVAFGGPMGHWTTWRWTPTTSWAQTPLSSTNEHVVAVTSLAWGAGTFVAAGFSAPFDADDAGTSTNPIWTSRDGMTWTPVAVPQDGSTICALPAVPAGGFVAVGRAAGHVVAWTSPDGTQWEVADVEPRPLDYPDNQATCAVVPVAEGLLTLVADGPSTLTWTSTDAGEWTAAEDLGMAVERAAAVGDQVVVVGRQGDSAEPTQVVMRGHRPEASGGGG